DPIVNLAKRRGFLFPAAEIYGGASGLLDLGPLGVELNNSIKQLWWKRFVRQREDMVGLDSAILTPAPVLKASGHVDSFSDPLIECANCKIRLRADHYLQEENVSIWLRRWKDEAAKQRGTSSKKDEEAAVEAAQAFFDFSDPEHPQPRHGVTSAELICPNPDCRQTAYNEPRQFNMMFKTYLGPVEEEAAVAYLRPETAQSIFTNFKNVLDTSRQKLPFGIAQIGKAFRNEITVGNSLFRVREFEQMEIEYFVWPGDDVAAHDRWIADAERFLIDDLGVHKENLRRYEHPKESLSHYSTRTVDLEYNYPFGGFSELWGIANRTDYDLRQHQEYSGKDLTYFDEESRERFIPYVIEPSVGVGRLLLTVLIDAYQEYPQGRDGQSGECETVLHLDKKIAPVQAAVLPLMKKDGLAQRAREVAGRLRQDYRLQYDESGAIGRRYRRQDEIGTPYCLTIDYQTLQDQTVTVRDRDSMEQTRVKIDDLPAALIF
ncbi:glycine--tRNA ligase, partial [Patescibacteria group bacterium]|nr:glycine--tRNA ligase [Patescibacteria group bacterium]